MLYRMSVAAFMSQADTWTLILPHLQLSDKMWDALQVYRHATPHFDQDTIYLLPAMNYVSLYTEYVGRVAQLV